MNKSSMIWLQNFLVEVYPVFLPGATDAPLHGVKATYLFTEGSSIVVLLLMYLPVMVNGLFPIYSLL